MKTITLTDIELIEYIFKDFKDPSLWREVHINKHRKKYYVCICGKFDGKYLTELQKYFEVLELESTEERTIDLTLRRKD